MNKAFKLSLLSVTLFTNIGLVAAATPGVYLGAGAGYSSLNSFSDASRIDNGGPAGRLFLGYNFNNYFGVEANYSTFNHTEYRVNDFPEITFSDKLNTISLVGKLYLPLAKESPVNIYGLFGLAEIYSDIDAKYYSMSILKDSNKVLTATAGVGASYDINQRLVAGFELSRFGNKKNDDNHVGIPNSTLATLSLAYKF